MPAGQRLALSKKEYERRETMRQQLERITATGSRYDGQALVMKDMYQDLHEVLAVAFEIDPLMRRKAYRHLYRYCWADHQRLRTKIDEQLGTMDDITQRIAHQMLEATIQKGRTLDGLPPLEVINGDVSLDEARMRPIWAPYLFRSSVSVLEGPPGAGKSQLVMALVAAAVRGERLPHCAAPASYQPEPVNVVMFDRQNAWEELSLPRGRLAGLDDRDFHRIKRITADYTFHYRQFERVLEVIRRTAARLCVFDVVQSFFPPGVKSNKLEDVARWLSHYVTMARELDCTFLFVGHVVKGWHRKDPQEVGMGSRGFAAEYRSMLLCVPDPFMQHPSHWILCHTKNNLGIRGPSVRYEMVKDTTRQGTEVSYIKWGERVDATAEEILGRWESQHRMQERKLKKGVK